ncbi:signal peptidase I [Micrococcales bacterium KH10]|nr:signal peptidase I [Micrococcales bacterium KH10]
MSNEPSATAGDPGDRPPLASTENSSDIVDEQTAPAEDRDQADSSAQMPKGRMAQWRKSHPWASQFVDISVIVVIALTLSFLIKTFLMQPFVIPSESMEDTFVQGDRVVVSKLSTSISDVRRGDIVVFRDTDHWLGQVPPRDANLAREFFETIGILPETDEQYLIKRIIAVGGDHIVCCTDDGLVTVNGTAITEDYLKPGSLPSQIPFEVTVPQDKLWVMGDNRQNSGDSRFHMGSPGGGFVAKDQVVGTAFATVWPLNRLTWHTNPTDVFDDIPDADGDE